MLYQIIGTVLVFVGDANMSRTRATTQMRNLIDLRFENQSVLMSTYLFIKIFYVRWIRVFI